MRKALVCALALAACSRAAHVQTLPAPGPFPASGPVAPAGTLFAAQLGQPLSTAASKAGDVFTAELLDPIVAEDGTTVLPKGARLRGVVRDVRPSKGPGSAAVIVVELQEVTADGMSEGVPLPAEIAQAPVQKTSGTGRALAGAAVGLGLGILAGALIDEDTGTAALGGAAGAVLGGGALGMTGRRDAQIPSGAVITLRLVQPLSALQPVSD